MTASTDIITETEHSKTYKIKCTQQKLRSVWVSPQSDQSLHCQHEDTMDPMDTVPSRLISLWTCHFVSFVMLQLSYQCFLTSDCQDMSHLMTKPTKWPVCPAKTQISLGIRPVWYESSLCTKWVAKDPSFVHADSEDSDQTGQMARLIWVFAGGTCHFDGFVKRRLIYAR